MVSVIFRIFKHEKPSTRLQLLHLKQFQSIPDLKSVFLSVFFFLDTKKQFSLMLFAKYL